VIRAATAIAIGATALAACDWSLHRMQQQPRCRVGETTDLFTDGRCNQPAPADTVPWQPVAEASPPVTRALVERGRDRFDRYCAPCHGIPGDGDSAVARAMELRKPRSLIGPYATGLSDARILTVIADGYGLMPSYATPLPPTDRYAVLLYVRVLQQREVATGALSPAEREEANRWLH
jgi:mono/diheme cytochrome c family protein